MSIVEHGEWRVEATRDVTRIRVNRFRDRVQLRKLDGYAIITCMRLGGAGIEMF